MFSQKSESVITSCLLTAFDYAVRRCLFDIINTVLNYDGFKSDLTFWISRFTQTAPSLKVCSAKNFELLIYLLQLRADPNVGLMQRSKDSTMLPVDVQRKSHSQSCFTGAPLYEILDEHNNERAERLFKINCLLYYGANPNIPRGPYYSTLLALVDNFGTSNEDIIPTVQMMVLCGLDMRSQHNWLTNQQRAVVTLGAPDIRQWLLWNVEQPMPLFHRCVVAIRAGLGPTAYQTVDSLLLPKQLKDYVLLKHIFK